MESIESFHIFDHEVELLGPICPEALTSQVRCLLETEANSVGVWMALHGSPPTADDGRRVRKETADRLLQQIKAITAESDQPLTYPEFVAELLKRHVEWMSRWWNTQPGREGFTIQQLEPSLN